MNLVQRLRDEIVDDSKPLSGILRRAKILATHLNDADLKMWLSNELNGYTGDDQFPEYRRLYPALLANFSGPFGSSLSGYSVPKTMLPESVREIARQLPIAQPVREIEAMVSSAKEGLRHILPTEAVILSRDKIQMSGGMVLVELYQPITVPNLEGILDAIRTRFLDFLLGLQELDAGILESDAALGDLSRLDVARTFNLTVYGDHNVIAPHSTLGDVTVGTVQPLNLDSLASFVQKLGVEPGDAEALRTAVQEDGEPEKGSLGKRVQQWIGGMVAKAVGGTWNVALSTAPGLLQEALFRYYGWK